MISAIVRNSRQPRCMSSCWQSHKITAAPQRPERQEQQQGQRNKQQEQAQLSSAVPLRQPRQAGRGGTACCSCSRWRWPRRRAQQRRCTSPGGPRGARRSSEPTSCLSSQPTRMRSPALCPAPPPHVQTHCHLSSLCCNYILALYLFYQWFPCGQVMRCKPFLYAPPPPAMSLTTTSSAYTLPNNLQHSPNTPLTCGVHAWAHHLLSIPPR